MRLRVVCGLEVTMATFWPTRRFSSVDFPAFGRPTMATNPDRGSDFLAFFFFTTTYSMECSWAQHRCTPTSQGAFEKLDYFTIGSSNELGCSASCTSVICAVRASLPVSAATTPPLL